MGKHMMHYETLLKVTEAISMSKDPEDVVVTTVEACKNRVKGQGRRPVSDQQKKP